MGKQNVAFSNGFSIQAMPVSSVSLRARLGSMLISMLRSAIMTPLDKTVIIHDGSIHLEGWAYSGNGNWPERVEVSPDGCVLR
jgi:sulfite oxidase